jgi:hypothetical protein
MPDKSVMPEFAEVRRLKKMLSPNSNVLSRSKSERARDRKPTGEDRNRPKTDICATIKTQEARKSKFGISCYANMVKM